MDIENYTGLKRLFLEWWVVNAYKMSDLRRVTCENGTEKKFSYEDFEKISGISISTYDSDVNEYKNLRYTDLVNRGYISY